MATGTVTLSELRDDLRARLRDLINKDFYDDELTRWLNIAQYRVAQELSKIFPEDFTTHAAPDSTGSGLDGINTYVKDDAMKILALFDYSTTPWTKYTIVEPDRFLDYHSNALYNSASICYIEEGNSVSTASTITFPIIVYLKKPAEMASDSNTMEIGDEYQDLVISYAMGICKDVRQDMDAKRVAEANIEQLWNDAFRDIQNKNAKEVSGVNK